MNKEFSVLNGYNVKDAYVRYKNVVNATKEGVVGDGVTDDTIALQNLIDKLYASNGGTIILEKNNYLISTINLKSKVNIIGNYKGNTCLIQTPNATNHIIIINQYCTNNEIAYLSLIGNQSNLIENDGINITEVNLTNAKNNHNTLNNSNTTHSETEEVSYKYLNIHDCFIGYFTNNGITINNNNYAININNCYISFNKNNGVYDSSNDNIYSNLQIERNGGYGLYLRGNNNKYVNIKSIWNGFSNSSFYGIYVKGSRNSLTNCEVQDNFCNGIGVQGYQNNFSSCISDCNGYDYQQYVKGTIVGVPNASLWYINGVLNSFYNCTASQYRATDEPIATYSINLDRYQKNNKWQDITIRPNSAKTNNVYYAPVYEPVNISLGNTDIINNDGLTIGPNSSTSSHIMKKLNITNFLSLMIEFKYIKRGNYPRLIGLDCQDTNASPRPLLLLWNGTSFALYLNGASTVFTLPDGLEFTSGLTYRFTINVFTLKSGTTMKLGVSYIDSNGNVQLFPTDSMEYVYRGNYTFPEINNIYLNNTTGEANRQENVIKKLLIANHDIPMQYQNINYDLKEAYQDGDFYVDFTNFNNEQTYPLQPTFSTTYIDNNSGGYKIDGEKIKVNLILHFKENAFNENAGNRINPISNLPKELYGCNLSCVDITNNNVVQAFIQNKKIALVCPTSFHSFNNSTLVISGEYYRKQ